MIHLAWKSVLEDPVLLKLTNHPHTQYLLYLWHGGLHLSAHVARLHAEMWASAMRSGQQ